MLSPSGVLALSILTAVIVLYMQWKNLHKDEPMTFWLSAFFISLSVALFAYTLITIEVPHPMDGFITILEPFVPFKSE